MHVCRQFVRSSPLLRASTLRKAASSTWRRGMSASANNLSTVNVSVSPAPANSSPVVPIPHVDSMARYPGLTPGGFLRGMDYAGTFLFASSGAVLAAGMGMDLLGTVAVGTITACGGGTIRDVFLLRRLPFWTGEDGEPEYLWMSAVAALATFFLYPKLKDSWPNDVAADAVSLGAFTCIGTMSGIRAGLSAPLCVLCAVMTSTGGGLTRDILTRRPVRIMHANAEIYATTVAAGSVAYLTIAKAGLPFPVRMAAGIATTAGVRWAAYTYDLRLPTWRSMGAGHLVNSRDDVK